MASGTKYNPRTLALPGLQGIDDATPTDQKVAAMLTALHNVTQFVNNEHRRLATSINRAAGTSGAIRTADTSGRIASTDSTVNFDTTSRNVTQTLPPARAYHGRIFTVQQIAGGNTATLAPNGSDTISGGGSVTITSVARYQADATANNWVQI